MGKLQFIAELLDIFSTIFARTSVALFVIRLFAVTQGVRRLLYSYTAFMIISLAVTGSLVFAPCTPAEALWNPTLAPTARCWSPIARKFIDYYNGAVGILSDFLLAMLPAYFLNRLQMQPRLKFALASLMAVGLVPGICAICRTVLTKQTAADPLCELKALQATLPMSDLVLDSFALLVLFGSLEASMLIITASIPALPPLFRSRSKSTKDGSPYGLRKLRSGTSKQTPNDHYTSKAKVSQVRPYIKAKEPKLDPFERSYEDEVSLVSVSSPRKHLDIGTV